ncbi:MAG TPA: hypothetical protein VJS92_13775 [Candidatus Polarisedimenticolaceae bacterium]|nr:hypothetical protein [Candidatus Polarisedimenticolaceae bacterium]
MKRSILGIGLICLCLDAQAADPRQRTLEDIFQATGNHFQAGIGFLNFEKNRPGDPDPTSGYGVSIDDMVVEWREYSLVPDAATCSLATATCHIGGGTCSSDADCPGAGNFCAGGACASVDLDQNNVYLGSSSLTITVMEPFPSNNDCNGDGDRVDVGIDDQDCNNNGTNDLYVTAQSDTEPAGERVLCERTANPGEYRGTLTLSTAYNSPGALFIQQFGVASPVVTVVYDDINDGTNSPCENDVDPAKQGTVEATILVIINDAPITVLFTPLADDKDNDGWADNNEDVTMKLTVQNKGVTDLQHVVARLVTSDAKIACILNTVLAVGDLGAGEIKTTVSGFQFKVADVHRAAPLDTLAATFSISMTGDEFDSLSQPQHVTLDLDLDATLPGGTSAGQFFEGFEGGTLGAFEVDDIDSTTSPTGHGGSLARSNGWRCQYSDPDWINSGIAGTPQGAICYLSNNAAHAGHAVRWSVNDPGDVDGGRSFSGTRSLYYGINPATIPAADEHTTPTSAMEAARTINPIHLGVGVCSNAPATACAGNADCSGGGVCNSVTPGLSFKHMISLMDWRTVNAAFETAADRAVAHVQFAGAGGAPAGDWIKLTPYANVYDSQAYDLYFSCQFDPADDGNDEDDFFDPTDPDRRLGPSSTCFPEFSWVDQGDTFENDAFGPLHIGRASDPPGLQGATGPGTWVEVRASLERFRGRSIRLRFLATSLSLSVAPTWQAAFAHNPDPGDDGWWIDDIAITGTTSAEPTLASEATINPVVPCGASCNNMTVVVSATPGTVLGAPGEALELDASGSTADRCVNGTLQFQFRRGGTILQDWSDNATFVDAPTANTTYTVAARCSSLTTCANTRNVTIGVTCPSSGTLGGPFQTIRAPNKTSFTWTKPAAIDFVRGRLQAAGAGNDVHELGTFSGTVISSGSAGAATSIAASADPVAGDADYYLVQVDDAVGTGPECNRISTWSSGSTAEDSTPGRDATLP